MRIKHLPVVIVTGEYGAQMFRAVLPRLERLAERPLRVLPVRNEFFGGNVAVAGLMVGQDVAAALTADDEPARRYLIPNTAVPGGHFLDDTPIASVAEVVDVPVDVVQPTVAGLLAGAVA